MKDASPEMLSLFCDVLERSLEERTAYLDTVCGQDLELRARLEALLRGHEQAGGFLREHAQVGDPATTTTEPSAERPDTVIGPYKLLEQNGGGGLPPAGGRVSGGQQCGDRAGRAGDQEGAGGREAGPRGSVRPAPAIGSPWPIAGGWRTMYSGPSRFLTSALATFATGSGTTSSDSATELLTFAGHGGRVNTAVFSPTASASPRPGTKGP
jgi:hypothetical protein